MVQLLSILAASLATCLTASAIPITISLGNTGHSLSISEDGSSVSLDGTNIPLDQAAKGASSACKPQGSQTPSSNAKAVYFITNAASNSIVSLKVAADGTLSGGSVTATGGKGLSGIEKGAPAAPDSLFSQGAIKVAGNNLIAVNPGSNTISMFSINQADPTKLTMVGKPVNTLGEFPVSVTISTKLQQACVANTGAKAGVACFSITPAGLTPLDTCLREFALNQTTPPAGPLNTVSQVLFNSDSSALMTTVKGDPTVNNTGFLSVFPVANNRVSTKEIRSSPNGTAVLFGTALLPSGKNTLFVTDASFGAATLSLSSSNDATVSAFTPIADQKATCWATFSEKTGTAFVTDVAVNHLVEVDTVKGGIVKEVNSTNGNPGLIDLVSAGNFLYALSPGNATTKAAVTVYDVSGGRGTAKEVQNFLPADVPTSAQGMAFF